MNDQIESGGKAVNVERWVVVINIVLLLNVRSRSSYCLTVFSLQVFLFIYDGGSSLVLQSNLTFQF